MVQIGEALESSYDVYTSAGRLSAALDQGLRDNGISARYQNLDNSLGNKFAMGGREAPVAGVAPAPRPTLAQNRTLSR